MLEELAEYCLPRLLTGADEGRIQVVAEIVEVVGGG